MEGNNVQTPALQHCTCENPIAASSPGKQASSHADSEGTDNMTDDGAFAASPSASEPSITHSDASLGSNTSINSSDDKLIPCLVDDGTSEQDEQKEVILAAWTPQTTTEGSQGGGTPLSPVVEPRLPASSDGDQLLVPTPADSLAMQDHLLCSAALHSFQAATSFSTSPVASFISEANLGKAAPLPDSALPDGPMVAIGREQAGTDGLGYVQAGAATEWATSHAAAQLSGSFEQRQQPSVAVAAVPTQYHASGVMPSTERPSAAADYTDLLTGLEAASAQGLLPDASSRTALVSGGSAKPTVVSERPAAEPLAKPAGESSA